MTTFTTPTGRLVGGDPFALRPKTDPATKTPVMDPKTGLQVQEAIVQLAFAKTDPDFWPFWQKLKAQDRADWPQFHGADGNVIPGMIFADKLRDGDGVNPKTGAPNSRKDGWANHWIVSFGSRFVPSVMIYDHAAQTWRQTTDPVSVKLGDYVQVQGSTSSNGSSTSPGMYRNVNMVALYGTGQPILRGADPNAAFAAPPPGAVTPNMVQAPAPMAPGAPVGYAAPAAPLQQYAPPVTPAQVAPPYDGYRQAPPAAPGAPGPTPPQQYAPPAAPAAPAPPPMAPAPPLAPPARVMLPAANGVAYEAYIANGWTDDMLRQHGMMA